MNENIVNFKVVLAGNAACGKTSLVRQFVDGQFGDTSATAGPEVSCFVYDPAELISPQLDGAAAELFAKTTVRLNTWDLPGQTSLAEATPMSLRNADCAFICFDITNRLSFDQVEKWLELVRRQSPNVMPILVGCKCDLDEARVISKPDADAAARSMNLAYFETSAKSNDNVQSTFKFVAVSLRQRWYASRPKQSPRQSVAKVTLSSNAQQQQP